MRAKYWHKAFLVVGLVVVMCGFTIQASAIPLTTFNFTQHSGFEVAPGTLVSDQASSPYNDIKWYELTSTPAPPSGDYNTIAWGRSNNSAGLMSQNPFGSYGNTGNIDTAYSALRVIGMAGTVGTGASPDVYGDWVTISTLSHQNNAINSTFATLSSAIIYSELFIGSFESPSPIPITFNETLNQRPCTYGNPNGTICDDLFTFPNVTFLTENFTYNGRNYEAEFRLANFHNSSSNYPNCVNGICTVWTGEGVTSTMDVEMALRELPVPEPATLTLLGLGLLGLGLAKRRSKNG